MQDIMEKTKAMLQEYTRKSRADAVKRFRHETTTVKSDELEMAQNRQVLDKALSIYGIASGLIYLAEIISEQSNVKFEKPYYREERVNYTDEYSGQDYTFGYHEYKNNRSRLVQLYDRDMVSAKMRDKSFWGDGRFDTIIEFALTVDADIEDAANVSAIVDAKSKIKVGSRYDVELGLNLEKDQRFHHRVLFTAYGCLTDEQKAEMASLCASRKLMEKTHG